MDRAGNEYDGLALADEGFRLFGRGSAGIGELRLNTLVLVEFSDSLGASDGDKYERAALGALTEFLYEDLIAGPVEPLEVANDALPLDEFAVGAHGVAEVGFGRGDRRRTGQGNQQREKQEGARNKRHLSYYIAPSVLVLL